MVALLLAKEAVDMTEGGAFLWEEEVEEVEECLDSRRRELRREGMVSSTGEQERRRRRSYQLAPKKREPM